VIVLRAVWATAIEVELEVVAGECIAKLPAQKLMFISLLVAAIHIR
jgi:hypothetical protein